jgi:hypothetical protein
MHEYTYVSSSCYETAFKRSFLNEKLLLNSSLGRASTLVSSQSIGFEKIDTLDISNFVRMK